MFLLRSMFVFMCSMPCLCAWIYVGCYAMCYFNPFCPLISFFLAFLLFQWGVDLDPVVQAYICTPRPILKGLDRFILHVNVFLIASMLYLHVSLSRSRHCHALCPSWACARVVTSIPPNLFGCWCAWFTPSPLRALLICLPCLLCATHLAFFTSLHLCTFANMFMHESVFCPYSNPMELWTLNPNLHLSSQVTIFYLITCLFASLCASHVCLPLFGIFSQLFFSMLFLPFVSLLVCWLVSFVFAYRVRVRPPKCEQKGKGCKQNGASPQRAMFNKLGGLAPPKQSSLSLSL